MGSMLDTNKDRSTKIIIVNRINVRSFSVARIKYTHRSVNDEKRIGVREWVIWGGEGNSQWNYLINSGANAIRQTKIQKSESNIICLLLCYCIKCVVRICGYAALTLINWHVRIHMTQNVRVRCFFPAPNRCKSESIDSRDKMWLNGGM